jgi:hypothetical protein
MKQVLLALVNHHDVKNIFPPGLARAYPGETSANKLANGLPMSTFVFLLPYMEQAQRYECCAALLEIAGMTGQTRPSGSAATATNLSNWDNGFGGKISTILCPSDAGKATPNTNEPARNNVVFCIGDYPTGVWTGNDNHIDTTQTLYRGVFGATFRCFGYDGLVDGSSNTIMISETVIGNAVNNSEGIQSTGMIHGDIRINAAGAMTDPSLCITSYTNGKQYVTETGSVRRMFCGRMYGMPYIGTTMFNTILPPNSPSCWDVAGPSGGGSTHFASATSNHTSGVNCGLGDGSVRFVSDTVDCGTTSSAPVTIGASPYGVWGAAGTRDGSESVALP